MSSRPSTLAPPSVAISSISEKRIIRKLASDAGCVKAVAFSPDGRYLATSEAENIQIWDLTAIRQRLRQMKLDWDLGERELGDLSQFGSPP